MVKCPRCGDNVSKSSKEWNYSIYHVKMHDCGKCEKSFKVYYRDGKFSHTIPKKK